LFRFDGGKKITRETVIVVGLGEIGEALFSLIKERERNFTVYGVDLNEEKMHVLSQNGSKLPSDVDSMHICLPCESQETFVETVNSYCQRFKPKLVIINSTVPPGTTKKIQEQCKCLVAHSPVRGVHKSPEHMKWEIRRWTKYVGGADAKSTNAARRHFEKIKLKVKTLKSCEETELAKLFETTYRAWMIACFQEMHRISKTFNADFDDVVDFIEDTHRVRLDRPVMFPGVIGGHCLIPNSELLLDAYDSEFLKLILKSNEKRKEDIKDAAVRREVEKICFRAEALEKELMKKLEKCD
jgi:UDP-N-acetyl-D-mannosaminuronate dehydrogenase